MKKLLIFGWCCFVVTTVFAQIPDLSKYSDVQQKVAAIDRSINNYLKESDFKSIITVSKLGLQISQAEKNDTLTAKYLYRLGATYRLMSMNDSALFFINKADKLANTAKKTKLNILCQLELSYIYERSGQIDSLKKVLKTLDELAKTIDSLCIEQAGIQNQFAISSYRKGKYEEALGYFLKCAKIYQYNHDSILLAKVLANIGSVYFTIKQEVRGLDYLHQSKAIFIKEHMGENVAMGEVYFNIARANSSLGRNDSAIFYYKKSEILAKKYNNHMLLAFSYSGLGFNYLNKVLYTDARNYLTQGLDISEKFNIKPASLDIYERLGLLYLKTNMPDKAKTCFDKAFDLAKAMGFHDRLADQYQNLAQAEAMLHHYDKAYQNQKIYMAYKDSINKETSSKNIAEMEAKYENEKKQNQIQLLNEQNKTQNLKLRNEKQMLYFLAAAMSLVLLIVVLLWRSYSSKQKINLALSTMNKEISSANEELTVLNEKLDEANQSKTKLFSIISHDLRSPVVSLFQFLKMQEQELDDLSRRANNETIIQSAENLAEVMEDLLIWAKSQMDYFELSLESIDIKGLLTEVAKIHEIQATQKELEIKLDCPSNLKFITDVNFLKIIIRNLVSNAIKFSPEKESILVSASMNSTYLQLTVKDNGTGLTQEQIADLFNWGKIRIGTTGIGLKLTKEFVEKLNGKLEVYSVPGKGSEFRVSLKVINK